LVIAAPTGDCRSRYTLQIAAHRFQVKRGPGGHRCPDTRFLAEAELEDEQTVRAQAALTLQQQPADDVEAVVAAAQGFPRLVIPHLGWQLVQDHRRHVRRVRHDQVEPIIDVGQQVRLDEPNPIADLVHGRIASGGLQGDRGRVGCDETRRGQLECQRDREAPASGADIGDEQRVAVRALRGGCARCDPGQRLFDDDLGFRPRHEHARSDFEVASPELPMPHDVRGGFAALAPRDERGVRVVEAWRCGVGERGQQARPVPPEHLASQQIGVDGGLDGIDPCLFEQAPRAGDLRVQRHGRRLKAQGSRLEGSTGSGREVVTRPQWLPSGAPPGGVRPGERAVR
jgi:hypothetical protein